MEIHAARDQPDGEKTKVSAACIQVEQWPVTGVGTVSD
jgi:hypothetical protein